MPKDKISQAVLIVINYRRRLFIHHLCGNLQMMQYTLGFGDGRKKWALTEGIKYLFQLMQCHAKFLYLLVEERSLQFVCEF